MKIFAICFFVSISVLGFAQSTEKKILFRGDSVWYAAMNNFMFSSKDAGAKWDTIFGKKNSLNSVFFNGVLDTSSNVFISDQKTIFIFGWDGTMLYKSIIFSSYDGGKTWGQAFFEAKSGVVGVRSFHKISSTQFFLDRRYGNYSVTFDSGISWQNESLIISAVASCSETFLFDSFGNISFSYLPTVNSSSLVNWKSSNGGLSWSMSSIPK